ncbi:NAD(P)-binding protein, partial [Pholiota conissans]
MTIFVTGATEKVGKSLAVKFDWFDEKTYAAPFEADPNIEKIFLIQPAIFDPLVYIKPFVELAITTGIKRFVYVSSSALEKGDFVNGKVHEYLADRGVDYVILRPTSVIGERWQIKFGTVYYHSIREKGENFSACRDGKVAYAARDALLSEKTTNNDVFIVGPQLYSHDEVPALLSDVPGRKITHRKLTSHEFQKTLQNFRMEKYAGILVYIHEQIASGNEVAVTKTPNAYVGKYSLP